LAAVLWVRKRSIERWLLFWLYRHGKYLTAVAVRVMALPGPKKISFVAAKPIPQVLNNSTPSCWAAFGVR